MITRSFALGSPRSDQWKALILYLPKYSTHVGLRFMSIAIFTTTRSEPRTHRTARRRKQAPRKHPAAQDTGKGEGSPHGCDLPPGGLRSSLPSPACRECMADRPSLLDLR